MGKGKIKQLDAEYGHKRQLEAYIKKIVGIEREHNHKARTLRDMREPPNSEATEQSVSIVAALTTEGDMPTTKTYAQMVTSVNNMDNLR